jgi:hypothetical protein
MTFSGINHWAVLLAGVLGFVLGGIWYQLLAEPWKAAHGFTTEQIHARKGMALWPMIVAFVADLIIAWMLAGVMGHLGEITVKNGIISAAFLWFGFVITTLAVNNMFGMRSPKLVLIDGGHWLAVMLLMGIVIGGWGL